MLIDSHVHVWQAHADFPGLTATIVSPHTPIPVELLNQYLDDHRVDRAVLVQPVYPGVNNSYVADCAAARPERFAAVCVVDPRQADAADQLTYWVRERGCRGLRLRPRIPQEEPIFGSEATIDLWEQAATLRAVVSILCNFEHLPTVARLARQFPRVNIVVDHLAHPEFRPGLPESRLEPLLALAPLENVALKVSGYYYYLERPAPFADCHPLFRTLRSRFGAERLIWGSDFPHVVLKTTYRRVLQAIDVALPDLKAVERDQVFAENAKRLYWW